MTITTLRDEVEYYKNVVSSKDNEIRRKTQSIEDLQYQITELTRETAKSQTLIISLKDEIERLKEEI